MPYTLSTHDEGRIILMTEHSDFNANTDLLPVIGGINRLLNEGHHPMVLIFDARAHDASDPNLPVGTLVCSNEGRSLIKHPKLLKIMAVTGSREAQLTLKGINSAMFGFVEIGIFPTMEEANQYARWLAFQRQTAPSKVRQ
jgi:hypothetical protein